MSSEIYAELDEVIHREKFKRYQDQEVVEILLENINDNVIFVEGNDEIPLNSRDPKDDMFLKLAFKRNVPFLVTDDKDLLSLAEDKKLGNIRILNSSQSFCK